MYYSDVVVAAAAIRIHLHLSTLVTLLNGLVGVPGAACKIDL
jgi:hypothetical protein